MISFRFIKSMSILEQNLSSILQIEFPVKDSSHPHDLSLQCGICYSYRLGTNIPDQVGIISLVLAEVSLKMLHFVLKTYSRLIWRRSKLNFAKVWIFKYRCFLYYINWTNVHIFCYRSSVKFNKNCFHTRLCHYSAI